MSDRDLSLSSFGESTESDDAVEKTAAKNNRPSYLRPRRRRSAGDKRESASKCQNDESTRRGSDSILNKKRTATFGSGDSASTKCSTGDEVTVHGEAQVESNNGTVCRDALHDHLTSKNLATERHGQMKLQVQSAAYERRPSTNSILDGNYRRPSVNGILDGSQRDPAGGVDDSFSRQTSSTCDPFSRQTSSTSDPFSRQTSGSCDPLDLYSRRGSRGNSRRGSYCKDDEKIKNIQNALEDVFSEDEDGKICDEISNDPVFKSFEKDVNGTARMKFLSRQFEDVLDQLTPDVQELVQESLNKMKKEWMSAAWQRIDDARERGRQCLNAEQDFRKKAAKAEEQCQQYKVMQTNYLKEVAHLRDRLNHGRTGGQSDVKRDDIELWEPLRDLDPATQALVVACVEEKSKCTAAAEALVRKALDSKISALQQDLELAEEKIRAQSLEIGRLTLMLNAARAGCSQDGAAHGDLPQPPDLSDLFSKELGNEHLQTDDFIKDKMNGDMEDSDSIFHQQRDQIQRSLGSPVAEISQIAQTAKKNLIRSPTKRKSKYPMQLATESAAFNDVVMAECKDSQHVAPRSPASPSPRSFARQAIAKSPVPARPAGHALAPRPSKRFNSRKFVIPATPTPSAEAASKSSNPCEYEVQDAEASLNPCKDEVRDIEERLLEEHEFVDDGNLVKEAPASLTQLLPDDFEGIAAEPQLVEQEREQSEERQQCEDRLPPARPASVAGGKSWVDDQETSLALASRRPVKSCTWHLMIDDNQAEHTIINLGKARFIAPGHHINSASTCKKTGGPLPSMPRPGSRSESRACMSVVDMEVPFADTQDKAAGRAAPKHVSISTGHSGVGWRKATRSEGLDSSVDPSESTDVGAFQRVPSLGNKSQDLSVFGQRGSLDSQRCSGPAQAFGQRGSLDSQRCSFEPPEGAKGGCQFRGAVPMQGSKYSAKGNAATSSSTGAKQNAEGGFWRWVRPRH